jgi:soluble lytic murein transglycosylase-like protein
MHRSPKRALLAALCLALLAATAVPAVGPGAAPANADIDQIQRELEEVTRNLEVILRELDAIATEIEAIDRRLGSANAELRRIRGDLALAEQGIATAEEEERDALALQAAAEIRLAEVEAELALVRARLQGRLVQTYKYGRTTTADIVMRGTVGALDLHEMALTRATVERITGDDRNLVRSMEDLAAEQEELIAEATAARVAAVAARDAAQRQRDRTAALEAQQRNVVAEINRDRARRQEVFDALEADKQALAALAQALTDRIRLLQLDSAAVLLPIGTVVSGVPSWAGALPERGRPYAAMINTIAASEGLDGRVLAALVWRESFFNPSAVSRAGAAGLAQLMPATARSLGLTVTSGNDQRFDPELNLRAGARYLRRHIVNFQSIELGLAAYNGGQGNVRTCRLGNPTPWQNPCTNQTALGGIPPFAETQFYVYIVLEYYSRIRG